MSIHFILGGAGAGKSYTLAQTIIAASRRFPQKRYLIIVPEQFTLQTQLDFVRAHPDHGLMNIDIVSFERLSYRVAEECGEEALAVLSETGKSFLLRRAAAELSEELTVFGRSFKRAGTVGEMKSLLSEFAQYGISTAKVAEMRTLCEGKATLSGKLADIHKLMCRFGELMGDETVTHEQLMERLSRLIPASRKLQDVVIGFDGFTGFTPVQTAAVKALLQKASAVYMTLDTDEPNPAVPDERSLFFLQGECMKSMMALAKETGQTVKAPYVCPRPYPRFRETKALAYLEKNLFRQGAAPYRERTGSLFILQRKNPKEEAAFTAREITRLIQEEHCRYRDIAVIVPQSADITGMLSLLFAQRHIPHFMDEKRDIFQNAFAEFLRAAVLLVQERYSYESVMRYLKCGLSGWENEDIFLLENVILARGIKGFSRWQRPLGEKAGTFSEEEWQQAELLRQKLVTETAAFVEEVRQRGRTVESVTRALYAFIEQKSLQQKLVEKEETAANAGLMFQAKEYAQIYKAVMELLDQLVLLLGQEHVSVPEYRELLEAGLSEAKIGIVPPGRDQVMIGDMERTRLGRVKYVFFLGLNDACLPENKQKGGLLTEAERRFLETLNITLSPGSLRQMAMERFYLYFSLTRAERRLYLTYAGADMDGKPMRPSCYLREIRRLFPEAEEKAPATQTEFLSGTEALAYLAKGMGNTPLADPRWKEVYRFFAGRKDTESTVRAMLSARYQGFLPQRILPETAGVLYGSCLRLSASALETYAACPFHFFARYGLGLKPRKLWELQSADEGSILHDALHRFVDLLALSGKDWSVLSEDEEAAMAEEACERAAAGYEDALLGSTARLSYTKKHLKRLAKSSIHTLGVQYRAGAFGIEGTEVRFGERESGLIFPVNGERTLSLTGVIDRLDVVREKDASYIKILDYKTGKKKTGALSRLWYGLDAQLLLYLTAAQRMLQKREGSRRRVLPAGMLYYRIEDPLLSRAELGNDPQRTLLEMRRPDGFFNKDERVLAFFDRALAKEGPKAEEAGSLIIPVKRNKDGQFRKNQSLLSTEMFALWEAHLMENIRLFGKEIFSGRVAAAPGKLGESDACSVCEIKTVCGFSKRKAGCVPRNLKELSEEEIISRLQGETA